MVAMKQTKIKMITGGSDSNKVILMVAVVAVLSLVVFAGIGSLYGQ